MSWNTNLSNYFQVEVLVLENVFSSVLVTGSTGKAATNVNGITLHSAFNLPVKSGLKSCGYGKPNDKTLLFSQLIPVKQTSVFMKPSKRSISH